MTLYVVATPIGNLGDMSPRAVETLKNVQLIAAEDTRVTMKLTSHFDIHTPLTSCHRHNEAGKAQEIVSRMLEEGIDVALVTDAGTPGVSDPGMILTRLCAEAGIPVVAVPGPTALAAALSVSGFDVTEFTFYGFLPREKKPLEEKLKSCARRMEEGHSIAQAAWDEKLFEPVYGRMLLAGERSGNMEQVLQRLTGLLEENCANLVDRLVGIVDPLLSGVLMLTVGLSLLSVMLPLIGMMNAVA